MLLLNAVRTCSFVLVLTLLASCARREDVDTSVNEDSISTSTTRGPLTGDSTNVNMGNTRQHQ
jgi:hypothetical protein